MDSKDPILTAALHLVWDERQAANSPADVAQAIRRHATAHAAAVLQLAVDEDRGHTGATALPDGRVVIVTEIWPRGLLAE